MREIKFRAWDTKGNLMLPWGMIMQTAFNSRDMQLLYDLMANRLEGKILMQYTGLKDRNGKDIYEGDIIKSCIDGETEVDVIEFSPPMFTTSKAIHWSLDRDEVIGNIYENPGLLQI